MATVTQSPTRRESLTRRPVLDVAWAQIDSPIGPLTVASTGEGLLMLSFSDPEATADELARRLAAMRFQLNLVEDPAALEPIRRELDQYFAGQRREFTFALDRRLWKGFRADVLTQLEQVPYGQVVSYAELAERAGRPRAVRAVGSAMATNPHPIVVACHRVLRTGGGVGGYGGGLDSKRWLLAHEGNQPT